MALQFISKDSTPNYTALSTDISASKIAGANIVGATVYTTDNANWYIIEPDLTLSVYALPVSLGGSITVGTVNQGTASATEKWLVTDQTERSFVDATNSYATPLTGGASFTGAFVDLTNYSNISVMVTSDVISASPEGLHIVWSTDGVNEDDHDIFVISAGSSKQYTFGVTSKYMKVDYNNGASAQSTFRLQTILHTGSPKPSSHRVDSIIVPDDDAELVKSVITGLKPSGTYQNMASSEDGVLLVGINDIQADAASRVRISNMTTLGDYKLLGFDRPASWSSAGTGTGTWANNKYTLSVTSGQYYVRETKVFHPYFSGKSQVVEETFYSFAPQANVTKRVGYFSSVATAPYASTLDGFWLESSGGSISIHCSRAGTSTLNVDIADWSGYENLNEYQNLSTWDNFTVIYFDFLWLGGAVLRMWLKTQYGFVLAHSFNYSGSATDTFTLSPNHPIRYEIVSTTGTGSLVYVCSQCSTEGSLNESGVSSFVHTPTLVATTSNTTTYPIKAIRKSASYRDVAVSLQNIEMMLTTANDKARWTLQVNPTLSAGLSYSALSNTPVEHANGNGTITVTASGTVIAGGYITSSSPVNSEQLQLNFLSWLGSTVDNVMDAYVLCIAPISGSLSSHSGLGFKVY